MIVRTRQLKSEFLQKTSDICETLFFYIRDGYIQKFEQLFEIHKDFIENKDKLGNTMLNYAVQNNMYDIVEYLIKNGAEINTYNNDLNLQAILYAHGILTGKSRKTKNISEEIRY